MNESRTRPDHVKRAVYHFKLTLPHTAITSKETSLHLSLEQNVKTSEPQDSTSKYDVEMFGSDWMKSGVKHENVLAITQLSYKQNSTQTYDVENFGSHSLKSVVTQIDLVHITLTQLSYKQHSTKTYDVEKIRFYSWKLVVTYENVWDVTLTQLSYKQDST